MINDNTILSSFDDLNRDLVTTVPTGISAKTSAPVYDFPKNSTPQFTIELNISNFNNYGVEDIRQLTNEVMETAKHFKGSGDSCKTQSFHERSVFPHLPNHETFAWRDFCLCSAYQL